ncbi:metallophosphoesterase [Phenylobacterium hankyongense]|uniref:Metallophosphoesterase n=1 Tax=Phenylobacterium hankyongense TaxID=1813876 RepID=A0A328B194_9CAUL|nr:metallophosphoesterase [Phenylobacterium hankyongense]RAK60933.1 metallophosphoesterase [Phenylobacterium hankyongense]
MSLSPDPETAPGPAVPTGAMRLAAIGDLHVGENHPHPYRELFSRISQEADVLALCGDLTNFGKTPEAEILAEDLQACSIPVVGVLGNHDFECGQPEEVARILHQAGLQLLDGEAFEIAGVGFAGAKGFIGGFGRYMLSAFGEPEIKAFVQASVDENLKLESSLRMLRTERTVVVLHYSPVEDTVIGEPPEIFPFLGSARMGETIDRFEGVKCVVHGHAHRGAYQGHTPRGIPVYNVARPVLNRDVGVEFALFNV